MLGFADLMLDCSLEIICIRKVLEPTDLALRVGGVSDETVK
jgi:predicted phosphoribosyltransferase